MGFKRRGILTKKYSLKGGISNLQEFQPETWYNLLGYFGVLRSPMDCMVAWSVITVHPGIGSGAGFKGRALGLPLPNFCPTEAAVVKFDNGFRARYLAALINCKD